MAFNRCEFWAFVLGCYHGLFEAFTDETGMEQPTNSAPWPAVTAFLTAFCDWLEAYGHPSTLIQEIERLS